MQGTKAFRKLCSNWGLADAIWRFLYIITLEFNEMYRDRLTLFELLDPAYSAEQYILCSEPASFLGFPYVRLATDSPRLQTLLNQVLYIHRSLCDVNVPHKKHFFYEDSRSFTCILLELRVHCRNYICACIKIKVN